MRILSVDVGKKAGAFVVAEVAPFSVVNMIPFAFNSFTKVFKALEEMKAMYNYEAIIIGEAFGQREVVKQHSKMYGIIEYFSELNDMYVIYVSDNTARMNVLGKGHGRDKEMVHKKHSEEYGSTTQDISDAILFAKYYSLNTA